MNHIIHIRVRLLVSFLPIIVAIGFITHDWFRMQRKFKKWDARLAFDMLKWSIIAGQDPQKIIDERVARLEEIVKKL